MAVETVGREGGREQGSTYGIGRGHCFPGPQTEPDSSETIIEETEGQAPSLLPHRMSSFQKAAESNLLTQQHGVWRETEDRGQERLQDGDSLS